MIVCTILIFAVASVIAFTHGLYAPPHTVDCQGLYGQTVFVKHGELDCSGAIIHPSWVISSGDCITYQPYADYYRDTYVIAVAATYTGHTYPFDDTATMQVRKVIKVIYQNVTNVPGGRSREIQLLHLDKYLNQHRPFADTWKVARMTTGVFPKTGSKNTACFVAGYGHSNQAGPAKCRALRVSFNDSYGCTTGITGPHLEKYICIHNEILRGVCAGDWGAPLLCNELQYLVGIAKRPFLKNGTCPHPKHCGGGDTIDMFTLTADVWRISKYYIPNMKYPIDINIAMGMRKPPGFSPALFSGRLAVLITFSNILYQTMGSRKLTLCF